MTGNATDSVRQTPFRTTLVSWAQMQVRGIVATRTFGAEPDIQAWANGCALNPARISAEEAK